MPHRFHPSSLREYDVRGIVGSTLGPADAYAIGRGFATCVRRVGGRRVAVGRDGRLSSPELEASLIEGLTQSGIDVVRTGLGPTPMLYFAEATLSVDGGIQVTGSHNPADYNGFKMVLGQQSFFGADIQMLGRMAEIGDWESGSGSVDDVHVEDAYVERLLENYTGEAFRVGWDAGNGAAGPIIEKLIARLPGEHHTLFTEIDGRFPNHHPDPTEEKNLADLRRLVSDKGLDFGLAFDGDGDRLGAIDGEGRVVWADQLLGILAEPVLRDLPGATIIADVKSSRALFDRVAALGGRPLMWKTGHSLMKTKMKETRAPLAGEMSGHIFFAHDFYGFDDAQYAALRLMSAVRMLGGSLTALKSAMPALVNTPELRFDSAEERKFQVVDEVLARLTAEGAEVDRTDGARVTTDDGWWLVRASNTQGVLVARAEASERAGLERLLAQVGDQLARSGIETGLAEMGEKRVRRE